MYTQGHSHANVVNLHILLACHEKQVAGLKLFKPDSCASQPSALFFSVQSSQATTSSGLGCRLASRRHRLLIGLQEPIKKLLVGVKGGYESGEWLAKAAAAFPAPDSGLPLPLSFLPFPSSAHERKLITVTRRRTALIFHFRICK